MLHVRCLSIAGAALAALASAQTVESTLRRVASKDPVQIAWGAYDAKLGDAEKLIPELRKALLRTFGLRRGGHASAAIFDGLIRLKATPPPGELRRWLSGVYGSPAIIVMSHDPKQYEELLIEIVRQRARSLRRPEWEAAGNLLVSIGSKHLAEVVLRDLVVQITVGVRDPKAADSGASVRNPESVARQGRGWSLPKGYPRYTLYELVDDVRLAEFRRGPQFVDKERLAGGPSKIWFVRHSKHWPKRIAPRQARSSADDHHVRIGWLAGLLGAKPKSLALQLRPRKSLEWSGDETFVRAVQRMVQEAEGHHRAVINRLIRQDRLEKGSRKELKLRTQVYVHDARRKPSQLPLVPGVRLRPIR